jgi:hypothetical protein
VLPPEEDLDADRKSVARRVEVGLAAVRGEQPCGVGAATTSLLGSDAELPDEVVGGSSSVAEVVASMRWFCNGRCSQVRARGPV